MSPPDIPAQPGFPFRFTCRRSGNCCSIPGGFVRVSDAEIAAIAAFLDLDEAACRTRYVRPSGDKLVDGDGDRCVFLADGAETACRIYPVRPHKCRTWPFWDELRDDPDAVLRASRVCPGIELD